MISNLVEYSWGIVFWTICSFIKKLRWTRDLVVQHYKMPKKTKRYFGLLNIVYSNETVYSSGKKTKRGILKTLCHKIRDFSPSTKLFPRQFLSLKTFLNKQRNPGYSHWEDLCTAQNMKFSIKDFFSKCDQPQETADLVVFTEKSLMENIIFCAVLVSVGSENLKFIMYVSSNLEKSLKTEKEFIFNKVLGL